MRLPEGFRYHRPVPREWQTDLETLTPRQERTTWLQLAWLAGEPWEPIQRWCVYEMTPVAEWGRIIRAHECRGKKAEDTIEWALLQELQGPNPRDVGHYDTVLKRMVSDCLISRLQWELYREHRAVPQLYWIIQGHHGGHKRRFTPTEQKYLSLAELPTDPPTPGDLPYAPYDRRVFDQLARRDRLQACNGKIKTEADEREFRKAFVGWLTEGMREVLESEKLDLDGIPRTSDDPTGMIEQATHNYIDTGRTAA